MVYCDTAQGTCSAIARTLLISSVEVATGVCCWAAASGQMKLYLKKFMLNSLQVLYANWAPKQLKLGCQCRAG